MNFMLDELIVSSVAGVLVFVIFRHFKSNDKKELEVWKKESGGQVVVEEFEILETKLDTFKSIFILSFYLTTFLTLIFLFAVVLSGTETGWYSMVEGVLWNYLVVWPVTSFTYFLLFSLRSSRSKSNTFPHFLFSYRFSQVKEFKLFINEKGIDGRFSLLWNKVKQIERDGNELRIHYYRKPAWLSSLLRADSFKVQFGDERVAQEVFRIWRNYGSGSKV